MRAELYYTPLVSISAQPVNELLDITKAKAQETADGDVRESRIATCSVISNPLGRYAKNPGYLIGCQKPFSLCTKPLARINRRWLN